jgi:hypothetical protein
LATTPYDGIASLALKTALVLWAGVGVAAAIYVGLKVAGMFNGKSYANARKGAIGAMILPLFGTVGSVTAFALIPAGALAFALLRRADWRYDFADAYQPAPMESYPVDETEAEPARELDTTSKW